MNGDVGKVPSGAAYSASPEPQPPTSEFILLNGGGETEAGGLEALSESGAGSATEQPSADPQPPIPHDQLKQMLSSQLEYYFSRENLANDTYLLSQMDNDQYVPIWTVANFNQVKKLTTDIKLITDVLRESPNVQVDDEGIKVRPNHKRCIVILREIPDSTPLDEVKGLFSGKGCPKLISCEFAHNNSWYVTFENDEDAQKAYRFLREEVREFQGKPIMARIKAKPMTMNRLPLPAAIGPGGITLKNGYRTPPAPTSAGPGVFDPTPFPQPAQRYLFSNGSSLPHSVNYTNQVQIYVSNFQQHQPFYPPSMLPTWGPTSPAYFDIGSVFSVNGLAPQGGPFAKSHTTRYTPRNRQKKNSGIEAKTTMSDSGMTRKPVSKENARFDSPEVQRHDDESYRPIQPKDQVLPPRRRRKEDEGSSRTSGSPGPQFDLEADSFPPLPSGSQAVEEASAAIQPLPTSITSTAGSPSSPSTSTTEWVENRLSDVVKGSYKGRLFTEESSNSGADEKEPSIPIHFPSQPINNQSQILDKLPSSRVTLGKGLISSQHEKPNRVAVPHLKEDSIVGTKTDEGSVDTDGGSYMEPTPHLDTKQQDIFSSSATTSLSIEPHLSSHQPMAQVEIGVVKLSYAQVAQHHHKEKLEREKAIPREQQINTSQVQPSPAQQLLTHQPQQQSDDEKKEHNTFHYQAKGDALGSRGRGGIRGAPRRRDNLPRQFNSRQRSPK